MNGIDFVTLIGVITMLLLLAVCGVFIWYIISMAEEDNNDNDT